MNFITSSLKKYSALLILINLSYCSKPFNDKLPPGVSLTLTAAGKNRGELMEVINHYKLKGDQQKLKAAYFLMENMIDICHYEGLGVIKYRKTFDKMDSLLKSGNGIFNRSWDSIQKCNPPPEENSLHPVLDISTIKSKYLINHIEHAFRAWNYPWAKRLSFDEFCEYILPYKLLNEEPDNWMSEVQKKYQYAVAGNEITASRDVCLKLNNILKGTFYINANFNCYCDLNFTDLSKLRTGKCAHATQVAAYTMRAFGVPVVMDYIPHWANKNFSHGWNALLYNGATLPFVGSESDPGKCKISFTRADRIRRKRGKVFRRMYSLQKESLAMQVDDTEQLPKEFRSRHIMDVTKDYVPVSDVSLTLNGVVKNAKFGYLCVFSDQMWSPVFWGEIGWFDRVSFKDMESGVVYMPAYFESNKLIPAGMPFILMEGGSIFKIEADLTSKNELIIKQKYPEDKSNSIMRNETYELFYWNAKWISLGLRRAAGDSLIYDNIPGGALLMVKNVNKGKQERIFTNKDGKQIWW